MEQPTQPVIQKQLKAIIAICDNQIAKKGQTAEYFERLKAECEFALLNFEPEEQGVSDELLDLETTDEQKECA